jgi:heme a synthase
MARDLAPRHFLESLIWIHPLAAVLLTLAMTFGIVFIGSLRSGRVIATLTKIQIGLFVLQLVLGGANLLLHAPVWLQLVHLAVADLVWVNLVLFTACVLAKQKANDKILVEEPGGVAVAVH